MSGSIERTETNLALLPALDAEEVLPALGPWSQQLGRRLLLGSTAAVLAASIWPWRESVRAVGLIRPAGETVLVQSSQDGSVAKVWVQDNQRVQRGQRLAELDQRSLLGERRQLEATLRNGLAQQQDSLNQSRDLVTQQQAAEALAEAQRRSADSGVDDAVATLRLRQNELRRYGVLLESGAVAASVLEEKQAQQDLARHALARARQVLAEQRARGDADLARLRQGDSQTLSQRRELDSQLEQTRARLAAVNRALANSMISAPSTGTVIATSLRHPQQVVRAGEVLAQIAPEGGRLLAKVTVSSRDMGGIRAGQRADLRLAACPYPEYGVLRARVLSVSADRLAPAGQGQASGQFLVSLAPQGHGLKAGSRSCALRQGMDIQADIITRQTTVLPFLLTRLRLISGQ